MLTFCDETKEARLVFKQSFETRIPGEGELLQLRYIGTCILIVCYTAVFSVVTQRSSLLTAAENRTTFLSLCVCGLTNKPIMYKKFDNT